MNKFQIAFGLSLLLSISPAFAGSTSHPIQAYLTQTVVNDDAQDFKVTKIQYIQRPTVETRDDSQCYPYLEPGFPCEQVSYSGYVSVIEVSYSFVSQSESLGQDNSSPYYEDTFYVDPSTLSAEALAEIPAKGMIKGAAAAGLAQVVPTTSNEASSEIDESKSNFCERRYDDSGSYQVDPNCQDQIVYKTVYKPVTRASVVFN